MSIPARSWMLPGERLAVRLMSTIWANAEGMQDDLRTRQDLDAWLDAVGIDRGGRRAREGELAVARELRDAVRALAAFVTSGTAGAAPGGALDVVNAVAAAPALVLRGGRLERGAQAGASPVAAGLARVALDAVELLGGDDAARLRACPASGCVLYFVKTHHRREWCSTGCGNRVRAARHYQRVRASR